MPSPSFATASGATGCGAGAINNNGQVVGWAAQTSTDADHAFLWSNGKMTDLGLNFFPTAVNDNGAIVGGNLIYSGGTLQDLNTLIPHRSPYQIQYATAINDNGQIVAERLRHRHLPNRRPAADPS